MNDRKGTGQQKGFYFHLLSHQTSELNSLRVAEDKNDRAIVQT